MHGGSRVIVYVMAVVNSQVSSERNVKGGKILRPSFTFYVDHDRSRLKTRYTMVAIEVIFFLRSTEPSIETSRFC